MSIKRKKKYIPSPPLCRFSRIAPRHSHRCLLTGTRQQNLVGLLTTTFTCFNTTRQRKFRYPAKSQLTLIVSLEQRCKNMVIKIGIFVVCGLFVNVYAQHDDHEHHRVNVAVYYESLCPDSIKFFTQQLYPSLQGNLSSYVNLTLLPYGKSTTTQDFDQFEFKCHHGPAECRGNMIHSCAIRLIGSGKNTEGLGFNKITTGFINCLMDKVKRDGDKTQFPTRDCATINKVQHYVDIENCANHVEGSKYLNDVGVQTAQLKPPLTSVPTIVFNNQYKQDDNELAQTNFVKALCQYIHGEKPAECVRNADLAVRFNIFLLLAALASATLFN